MWLKVTNILFLYKLIHLYATKVEDIRKFYTDVSYYVGVEINTAISNLHMDAELNSSKVIATLHSTLYHFQAESHDLMFKAKEFGDDMCDAFDLYRKALLLMFQFRDMRYAIGDITNLVSSIDKIYDRWAPQCPEYVSAPTGQLFSMFYIPTGKFLSQPTNNVFWCCQEKDEVKGDDQNNFHIVPLIENEVVMYGVDVAVAWKNLYLSSDISNFNWFKSWISDWEKFRLDNYCKESYQDYGVIRMCDLVKFKSLAEGGYYWKFRGRSSDNGPWHFILLDRNGSIPSMD